MDQLDLNGDCVIDFKDIATIADGWLSEGLMVPWPAGLQMFQGSPR